jgi:hypothetical protein
MTLIRLVFLLDVYSYPASQGVIHSKDDLVVLPPHSARLYNLALANTQQALENRQIYALHPATVEAGSATTAEANLRKFDAILRRTGTEERSRPMPA